MTVGLDADVGERKLEPEYDKEERLARFFGKLAFIALCVIVLVMGSCTMHSNTFDGERERAEAEQMKVQHENRKVQAEEAEVKAVAQSKKTEAIKDLIEKGYNPVGVRCAIEGWSNQADREACERIGLSLGGRLPAE